MQVYDAIVVGAGHNGLVAANYLAKSGMRVLVLERRGIVGGACVTEEVWPGYRISTAAYLCSLLSPKIIVDLEMERHGFDIYERETAGFAPYPDGSHLVLYSDSAKTRAEIERFCTATPSDVEAYFKFEADIERAAAIIEPWLLNMPPTTEELKASFISAGALDLYYEFVTGSVEALLDARFKNEKLKAVFATDGLIGTYGGPRTPGTAYVLLHHYLGKAIGIQGAWGYVRGGMGRITEALSNSFHEFGGEIKLNSQVESFLLADDLSITKQRIEGVRLSTGEEIHAPVVLSNADPYHTFVKLLGNPDALTGANPAWNNLITQGGASAKINLAVSELPMFTCLPQRNDIHSTGYEHLGTIHFCTDMAALEQAWQECRNGYPSREPMIEMYLQSSTDSSLTPPGKHILSLFVQYFPYNLANGLNLNVEREKFADRVIEIIARYAPNVPASILHRQILTPRDLEERFGLTGGHIFHGDLLPPNLWSDRPASGFKGSLTPISGLYLCGSGAHPGGCVSGAPGYNAAHQILFVEK